MQQEEQEWEAAPICLLEVGALRQGRDPLQLRSGPHIKPAPSLATPAFSPLSCLTSYLDTGGQTLKQAATEWGVKPQCGIQPCLEFYCHNRRAPAHMK